MKLSIRYFAGLREALGPGEALDVEGPLTIAAVRDALILKDALHAATLSRERFLRSAFNQVLCAESALVEDDAEIAFFPPLTGG